MKLPWRHLKIFSYASSQNIQIHYNKTIYFFIQKYDFDYENKYYIFWELNNVLETP